MDPINEVTPTSPMNTVPPVTASPQQEEKTGAGGIIAIIIIILVLAVGGYYVWQSVEKTPTVPGESTAELSPEQATAADIAQIEADLQSLDSLADTSADTKSIEAELLQ
jgi:uncharacterized protein HemX